MLLIEPERRALADQFLRRQLFEQGRCDRQHQAGIAAGHRMADLITLSFIEQQDMVGIRHGQVAAHVPQVQPAIGEHEVRVRGAFLGAAVPAAARAVHETHGHRA